MSLVGVYGLRPSHPNAGTLVAERSLRGIVIEHTTLGRYLLGLAKTFLRINRVVRLLRDGAFAGTASETWRLVCLLPAAMWIVGELERRRPDVVHLYWGHYPALVGILLGQSGFKTTMNLIAYDLEKQLRATRLAARHASWVYTVSEVNRPAVARLGVADGKIRIVRQGVDVSLIKEIQSDLRDPYRIVSVGRLIQSKRFDLVIESFISARTREPEAVLEILGDGPEMPALRKRAEEKLPPGACIFRGHVDHHEVIRTLKRSGVFVFLSFKSSERLPNVAKEAVACGCYSIVALTPGVPEIIASNEFGVIVSKEQVAEVPEHILRGIARSRNADGSAAARALAFVEKEFNREALSEEYVTDWRNLCDKTGS